MFSIGEFSRISRLSIKSLRLYHDKGILIPCSVDEFTGYRYYDEANIETAKAIAILKQFDFSLNEISEILKSYSDESDIIDFLEEKQKEIEAKISRYADITRSMERIIKMEKEASVNSDGEFEIEEKEIETILIAGYRMKGRYSEAGKGFDALGNLIERNISGKAMSLFYDGEYKEEGADFEPCFPVRKGKSGEGISVRELKGGRTVSLIHKGPYETLGNSYKRIFSYINDRGLKITLPTREIYIKGTGPIFKGNPLNYLTEIIFMIED